MDDCSGCFYDDLVSPDYFERLEPVVAARYPVLGIPGPTQITTILRFPKVQQERVMTFRNHIGSHITAENQRTIEIEENYQAAIIQGFECNFDRPIFATCTIRVLLVADGALTFSPNGSSVLGQFGLRTFADSLLSMTEPTRVRLSLAHRSNPPGGTNTSRFMGDSLRIHERLAGFRFDDAGQFNPDNYDVVFLFGFSQATRSTPLATSELEVVTGYMNRGGGLFATGDHGDVGSAMCQNIPRVRNMRLWEDNSNGDVSMLEANRNDTTLRGHGSEQNSEFNDQSDDVPQHIFPKLYVRESAVRRYAYPHPLLCSPRGVIRVMPDHAHEGECVEPEDPDQRLPVFDTAAPEYPDATDGGPRPLPVLISTNSVQSGSVAYTGIRPNKSPTRPHSFGGICAYDGHRARVGRVVTDATWHHFVNVNLTGDKNVSPTHAKYYGFLISPEGQEHFEEIKTYYRNLVVWLSRPETIRCINYGWVFRLTTGEAVVEAIVTHSATDFRRQDIRTLRHIGVFARSVLGNAAGQCESVRLVDWILDMLVEMPTDLLAMLATRPWIEKPEERISPRAPHDRIVDIDSVSDAMLGAALIAAYRLIADTGAIEKITEDELIKALRKGGNFGLRAGLQNIQLACREANTFLQAFENGDQKRNR